MTSTRSTISAYIICKNEESHIRRCLQSVAWCDEIVLVDSGSTDATLAIAREFTSLIHVREWSGYGDQKNFALSLCTCDWVLNLDADEEVSSELKSSLFEILAEKDSTTAGYFLLRVVNFLDRWWYAGDWYPEYRLRFGKRCLFSWSSDPIHEKARVQGKKRKLRGALYHYTYQDITHQVRRINEYSSLMAAKKTALINPNKFLLHYLILASILIRPLFRFIRFYILKRGFLYGVAGLIVALNDSYYVFLKYAKLWEALQETSKHQNQQEISHENLNFWSG
jgi:glycosyltransferase involved in cell wall biosynthesis